jgi:hypothetical protein
MKNGFPIDWLEKSIYPCILLERGRKDASVGVLRIFLTQQHQEFPLKMQISNFKKIGEKLPHRLLREKKLAANVRFARVQKDLFNSI